MRRLFLIPMVLMLAGLLPGQTFSFSEVQGYWPGTPHSVVFLSSGKVLAFSPELLELDGPGQTATVTQDPKADKNRGIYTTKWTDATGAEHSVSTSYDRTNPASIRNAINAHATAVRLMQAAFPSSGGG